MAIIRFLSNTFRTFRMGSILKITYYSLTSIWKLKRKRELCKINIGRIIPELLFPRYHICYKNLIHKYGCKQNESFLKSKIPNQQLFSSLFSFPIHVHFKTTSYFVLQYLVFISSLRQQSVFWCSVIFARLTCVFFEMNLLWQIAGNRQQRFLLTLFISS